jgi:uncharacterized protein YecT (DUF1311 family)
MRSFPACLAVVTLFLLGTANTLRAQARADTLCSSAADQMECLRREFSLADITLNKAYGDAMRAQLPDLRQQQRAWIIEKEAKARSFGADSVLMLRYLVAATEERTAFIDSVQTNAAVWVPGGDSAAIESPDNSTSTDAPFRQPSAQTSPPPATVAPAESTAPESFSVIPLVAALVLGAGILAFLAGRKSVAASSVIRHRPATDEHSSTEQSPVERDSLDDAEPAPRRVPQSSGMRWVGVAIGGMAFAVVLAKLGVGTESGELFGPAPTLRLTREFAAFCGELSTLRKYVEVFERKYGGSSQNCSLIQSSDFASATQLEINGSYVRVKLVTQFGDSETGWMERRDVAESN